MTIEPKSARWALVPVEATAEMLDAGTVSALSRNFYGNISEAAIDGSYAAMNSASPGAALLAEVLAARDALRLTPNGSHEEDEALYRLLAALDKLGPAAEGVT